MKFSELVRLLEREGFRPVKEKERTAATMINLPYSLAIEATADPDFFSFYSPDREGFSGVGHSIEDCLYRARWGMADHSPPHVHVRTDAGVRLGRMNLLTLDGMENWKPEAKLVKIIQELQREARL